VAGLRGGKVVAKFLREIFVDADIVFAEKKEILKKISFS
jgi:hypothetical protein